MRLRNSQINTIDGESRVRTQNQIKRNNINKKQPKKEKSKKYTIKNRTTFDFFSLCVRFPRIAKTAR